MKTINNKKIHTNIYIRFFLAYILSMIFLSSIRIYSYIISYSYFKELSFSDTILAFITGLQADTMAVTYCVFFPMVAILILKAFRAKFIFIQISVLIWIVFLGIVGFSNVGVVSFFEVSLRHPMGEIKLMQSEILYTLELTFVTYFFRTLSLIITLVIFFKIFNSLFKNTNFANNAKISKNSIFLLLFIVFIFVNGRGFSFGIKPFGYVSAYDNGKVAGDLAINGALIILKAYESKNFNHNHNEFELALKQYKDIYHSSNFKLNTTNPLYKQYQTNKNKNTNTKANNYNVIVIMIESLNYFKPSNKLYKLTPFLNALKQKSVSVNNFYANGRYSILGITNILASTPRAMGTPTIGWGYEVMHDSAFISQVFQQRNYYSAFLQASPRNSFWLNNIYKILGFDEYYGGQDYPKSGDEQTHTSLPFRHGWDGDMLRFANKQANKKQAENKAFFMMMFGATTHYPFISAGGEYDVYPNAGDTGVKGYSNALHYVDKQLELFFAQAKKEPWFDNTIFVITGDHASGSGYKKEQDGYRVPLIMYAPKILPAKQIDITASQIDIAPSLMQILNWDNWFMSGGVSIFDDSVNNNNRFVWVVDSDYVKMFDKNEFVQKTGNAPIKAKYKTNNRAKQLAKQLLSIDQVSHEFLKLK